MKILKIVLTGGPRAGKTSIIPKMKEYLKKQPNSYVIVVPESATELINIDICPSSDKAKSLVFQDAIYVYQKAKEDVVENYLQTYPEDANVYIIFDRGILDNRGYLEEEEFDDILNKYNDSELRILSNYDVVYGLCSSSRIKGQYETESNAARYEDEAEALYVDKKTIDSWKLHNNYKIIDATEEFEDKVNIILESLKNICESKDKRTYKRYILDRPCDLNILDRYNAKKIKSIDHYINYHQKDALFIVEQQKYKDAFSYNMQVKKWNNDEEITLKSKNLTLDEYNELLNYNRINKILYRDSYTFIKDNQIWNLQMIGGKYFLEVETTLQHPTVILPKELSNAIEISNEVYYDQIADLGYNRTLKL